LARTARPSFFESDEHRRLFLDHLKRRDLPLKFAYAGSAAYTHDELAKTASYRVVAGEAKTEARLLAGHQVPTTEPLQLAEIGPGNGTHSAILIKELGVWAPGPVTRYLALDFSRNLLNLAVRAISSSTTADVRVHVWDVESGPTEAVGTWRTPGRVVALLLGSTLGNLHDPVVALRHLRASVEKGDLLLMGAALLPTPVDERQILQPYEQPVFRAAALEPLRAIGIDTDDCGFRVWLDGATVRADALLTKAVRVDGLMVERGTRIRCFQSRRFTRAELEIALQEAAWQPLSHVAAENKAQMTILAAAT
jgi:L-histidine N-alpha-methyltransferase